jgi:DNA-binding GntR family transcriptional regulator
MQRRTLPERPNLSTDIASEISQMIFEGALPPGGRINEVRLAEDLGVSRTPLREALAALAGEGVLVGLPRRGLRVRELTASDARDIYLIRALLDPEALRVAGVPDGSRLDRLEEIREQLLGCDESRDAVDLDDAWHRELWCACPNSVLVDLVEQFMRRTRRYELASMGESTSVKSSARSKARIVSLLRTGDLDAACEVLRSSLLCGVEPVLAWLGDQGKESADSSP